MVTKKSFPDTRGDRIKSAAAEKVMEVTQPRSKTSVSSAKIGGRANIKIHFISLLFHIVTLTSVCLKFRCVSLYSSGVWLLDLRS